MKRSIFLLITALLAFVFGVMMLLFPDKTVENFGLAGSPELHLMTRIMGGAVFCSGLLNFMVRSHPDSSTLAAVLWFNVATHALGLAVDASGISSGLLDVNKLAPGWVVHLFVGIGSIIYLMRMRRAT